MKQLTCEMCGSTDLMKQDGVFVCQTCGCKYSIEEAKKMMVEGAVDVSGSTVKVDTQQKKENLYEIARRARDENNSTSAAKYYDMILQEDPFSWEASFYATYYTAMGTKIGQIADSAATVRNCFASVLNLIKDRVPENSQQDCVKEIIARVKAIADMYLYNAEQNKDNEHSTNWARAALKMQYDLGDCIGEFWPENDSFQIIAAIAWKEAVENELRWLNSRFNVDSMNLADRDNLYDVVNLYMKKIGTIDKEYYQKYLEKEKSVRLDKLHCEIAQKEHLITINQNSIANGRFSLIAKGTLGCFFAIFAILYLVAGELFQVIFYILWAGFCMFGVHLDRDSVSSKKSELISLQAEIDNLKKEIDNIS